MIPLLSVSYLPPIPYLSACVQSGEIVIDRHEHFVKQTHRNRALILTSNGILPLIIPVKHDHLFRIPIDEVRISYATDWQKIHRRSIISAYRNSAFFDYFEDDFDVFFRAKYETLFEFDLELLRLIFRLLHTDVTIRFTASWEKEHSSCDDLRNFFDPKKHAPENTNASENRYRQVFSSKDNFIPDLSIVDLLFNEGLKSTDYLSRISQ